MPAIGKPSPILAAARALVLAALALVAGLAWSDEGPVVLVLGDSLSAGYGIDVESGWVALLEARIEAKGRPHRVVNASVSGDTTSGGRARLADLLDRYEPAVVVVELGGNDGLRGISLDVTRDNLAAIVDLAQEAGAKVLLLGMELPPNYGPVFTERFHAIYAEVAREHGAALVPSFLAGVGERLDLMQSDGIHPIVEAQPRLLDNVWPHLEPLL